MYDNRLSQVLEETTRRPKSLFPTNSMIATDKERFHEHGQPDGIRQIRSIFLYQRQGTSVLPGTQGRYLRPFVQCFHFVREGDERDRAEILVRVTIQDRRSHQVRGLSFLKTTNFSDHDLGLANFNLNSKPHLCSQQRAPREKAKHRWANFIEIRFPLSTLRDMRTAAQWRMPTVLQDSW